jgi:hypothetical protein
VPRHSRTTGVRPVRQTSKVHIDAIVDRRTALVAEIGRLRAAGAASRFLENAQMLLTLWWSKADWAGREQLLKSASWQVGLAKAAT